jgi:transposase
MSMRGRTMFDIPEETVRVAQAAFPKGNVYMTMRDELGLVYTDHEFAGMFAWGGQPAEAPGLLAMVTIMQYAEGMTDRQTAEGVRSRIDWKYALGLELSDPGFDHSVLSQFRDRLIANEQEEALLEQMLTRLQEKELLKGRGRQRTDSTHVLAATRQLNRLECVGEALRQALNVLAEEAPEWLLQQVRPDWFDRYVYRFEMYRLPKKKADREALQEQIGGDGVELLSAIYADEAPLWLRQLPAVEMLRRIWVQQYYLENGAIYWRARDNMPPNDQLIQSPYEPDARNRTKRDLNWTGYTAHLTETCDEHSPNVITHVETTPATTPDVKVTAQIHTALDRKKLLPREHFVDTAYVDGDHLASSRDDYQLDLVGPVPPDNSWQANAEQGFDIPCFQIDWANETVTCPEGHLSHGWYPGKDGRGNDVIKVQFAQTDCRACPSRVHCTRGQVSPRMLRLRPKHEHEALQYGRDRQQQAQFKERYKIRAGVEGAISQGVRAFDLRRARYIGLAKTHLQHIATAAAINLSRVVAWLTDIPKAQTRCSKFAALAPVT